MSSDPPWKNPGISLGARCVMLARHEQKRGVKANPYGQPNTSEAVKVYLAPCLRDLDGDGDMEKLGLTVGNWCAAFASWCMEECLLPGEMAPHEYRAGVVEIVADAQGRGLWHPVSEVRSGLWTPNPGDLVIWDRSTPGKPETAWHRHVNRLIRLTDREMLTIGGNEGRTILEGPYHRDGLKAQSLLGFVSYYQKPQPVEVDAETRAENLRLVAAFVQSARQGMSIV